MRINYTNDGAKLVLALLIGLILTACGTRGDLIEMEINEIDLSRVEDGIYLGEYGRSRWLYQVEVTVGDHKITDMQILKGAPDGGMGSQKLNRNLIQAAIDGQSITFDAVSGASVNTKVFQKAADSALTQGNTSPSRN
jgi:uncharacterized protein with FMN-binding domain